MSAQIISFVQEKGGSGKSTLTCCLAGAVAEAGGRALIVDTDPQQTCMAWMKQNETNPVTVLSHIDEDTLLEEINSHRDDFDMVLIDTAGYKSAMAGYAIQVSDLILVPCKPSEYDLQGAVRTMRHIKNLSQASGRPLEHRIVLTDADPQTKIFKAVEVLLDELGLQRIRTPMKHLTGYREMATTGDMPVGSARRNFSELLASMQIDGLLDYWKTKEAA